MDTNDLEGRIERAAYALDAPRSIQNATKNLAREALEAAFPELFANPPSAWLAPWELTLDHTERADRVLIEAQETIRNLSPVLCILARIRDEWHRQSAMTKEQEAEFFKKMGGERPARAYLRQRLYGNLQSLVAADEKHVQPARAFLALQDKEDVTL